MRFLLSFSLDVRVPDTDEDSGVSLTNFGAMARETHDQMQVQLEGFTGFRFGSATARKLYWKSGESSIRQQRGGGGQKSRG
jgi:hypothetical protein